MSVGFSLVAEPALDGLDFDFEPFAEVAKVSLRLPAPLSPLLEVKIWKDALDVRPTPLEEEVSFFVEADRLVVSAKTSSLGPGYHASLIEALDALASAEDIRWIETEDRFDESGYFESHDFAALQHAHNESLKQMSVVAKSADLMDAVLPVKVGMPTWLDVKGIDAFALTQRGPRDRSFFDAPDPARHFPWWDRDLTRAARLGIAEALLWIAFPWRAPLSEAELTIGEAARLLIEGAGSLAPGGLKKELAAVLDSADLREPEPDGMGYLRHQLRRTLVGPWSVEVPGYFLEQYVEEDGFRAYWCGSREIGATSFTAERDTFDIATQAPMTETERSHATEDLVFFSKIDPWTGESGAGWQLVGEVQGRNDILTLVIKFPDGARDWADALFRSIKLKAPAGPDEWVEIPVPEEFQNLFSGD